MTLIGWIRLRLGRCQMGNFGCNARPAGTWDLNGFRVRLCARHWSGLVADLTEYGPMLGTWTEAVP